MLLPMLLHSFLWLSSIPLYMYRIFCIYSSVSGHSGSFQVLVIVNSASVNVGCMYLFELEFCVDVCPGVGLLNLNGFPGASAGKESA